MTNTKTTFGALSPGDVFDAVGMVEIDRKTGGSTGRFRKMDSRRAFRTQDFTTQLFPAEWPVTLVDSVMVERRDA